MCDNTAVLYPIIFSYLVIQYDYSLSEAFSNGTKKTKQKQTPPIFLIITTVRHSVFWTLTASFKRWLSNKLIFEVFFPFFIIENYG